MAIRLALVAALLAGAAALCIPSRSVATGQDGRCLQCHRVHYQERGGCTYCHRGNPNTARREIAHHRLIAGRFARFRFPESTVVQKGSRLWDRLACRRCHRIDGRGNRLAATLDRPLREMDANELEQSLADPALYMPDFRFTLEQRTQLVAALLSRAGRAEAGEPEKPKVVHFRAAGDERAVFADQCGDCHKVLSRSSGGLGEGSAGPNLSGLFTRFHPRTFPEDRAWSPDRLRKWLDNPRQVRAGALMPPVPLSREQERDLLQTWLPERPGRH